MTREESREAILAEWHRLPVWKRRNTRDAADFAQIMLTSRPELANFECPFDRFLVLRAWLVADQSVPETTGSKRKAQTKKAS